MITIDCEQYSPIWWAEHKGLPGGSAAASVITPSKWQASSQIDGLCYELLAQLFDPYYGRNDGYVTAAMRNGTILEPEARAYAELLIGQHIRQVGLCLTDCRRFCCSPDGIADDAIVELKSPMHKTHIRYLHKNETPPEYLPQIHWNLVVTESKKCVFMSYCRELRPLITVVERDERTESMRVAMEAFSKRYEEIKKEVMGDESGDLHSVLTEA